MSKLNSFLYYSLAVISMIACYQYYSLYSQLETGVDSVSCLLDEDKIKMVHFKKTDLPITITIESGNQIYEIEDLYLLEEFYMILASEKFTSSKDTLESNFYDVMYKKKKTLEVEVLEQEKNLKDLLKKKNVLDKYLVFKGLEVIDNEKLFRYNANNK